MVHSTLLRHMDRWDSSFLLSDMNLLWIDLTQPPQKHQWSGRDGLITIIPTSIGESYDRKQVGTGHHSWGNIVCSVVGCSVWWSDHRGRVSVGLGSWHRKFPPTLWSEQVRGQRGCTARPRHHTGVCCDQDTQRQESWWCTYVVVVKEAENTDRLSGKYGSLYFILNIFCFLLK